MKCFIDSNVSISAGLFPNSVSAAAVIKALTPPNTAFVSDYSLDETHRKISEKFPDKVHALEEFLYRALFTIQLIKTPPDVLEDEEKVSDPNDRPIIRAAINADVDVLITGDKRLLASDIVMPRIITPKDFLESIL